VNTGVPHRGRVTWKSHVAEHFGGDEGAALAADDAARAAKQALAACPAPVLAARRSLGCVCALCLRSLCVLCVCVFVISVCVRSEIVATSPVLQPEPAPVTQCVPSHSLPVNVCLYASVRACALSQVLR